MMVLPKNLHFSTATESLYCILLPISLFSMFLEGTVHSIFSLMSSVLSIGPQPVTCKANVERTSLYIENITKKGWGGVQKSQIPNLDFFQIRGVGPDLMANM